MKMILKKGFCVTLASTAAGLGGREGTQQKILEFFWIWQFEPYIDVYPYNSGTRISLGL